MATKKLKQKPKRKPFKEGEEDEDAIEAALLLGRKQTEKVSVLKPKNATKAIEAISDSRKRPQSSINTMQIACFVTKLEAEEFFQDFAYAICEPLLNEAGEETEEYSACLLANSTAEQGAPYYDTLGNVVGSLVGMPCTERLYKRIREYVGQLGQFFNSMEEAQNVLTSNGLSPNNPTEPT